MNGMSMVPTNRRYGLIAYIPGTESYSQRRMDQAALAQSAQTKLADKKQRDAQLKSTVAQHKINDELAAILKRQVTLPKDLAAAIQRADSGRMKMLSDEHDNLSATFKKLVKGLAILKNADRKLSGAILDGKIADVLETTASAIAATIGSINPSNINETNKAVDELMRDLERGIEDMFQDEDAVRKATRPQEETFTEEDLSPQLRELARAELEAQRTAEINRMKDDLATAEKLQGFTSQGQQALANAKSRLR